METDNKNLTNVCVCKDLKFYFAKKSNFGNVPNVETLPGIA
jgi:hypothetical protein